MSQNGSDEGTPGDEVVWLTTAEALKHTRMARPTLFRLVNEGKIPAYRPNRNFRFKQHELDAYLDSTRVQPGDLDDLVRHWSPDYKRE